MPQLDKASMGPTLIIILNNSGELAPVQGIIPTHVKMYSQNLAVIKHK